MEGEKEEEREFIPRCSKLQQGDAELRLEFAGTTPGLQYI